VTFSTLGCCCFRFAPQQTLKPFGNHGAKMRKSSIVFVIISQIFSLFGFRPVVGASDIASAETKEERATRTQKDRDVLTALSNAGSNLKRPHEIEFHFVSYDKTRITAVADEGKKMGYQISDIDTLNDEQNGQYWYFDLLDSVVPSEENIFARTKIMTNLAKKHSVEFDGWGCLIVK